MRAVCSYDGLFVMMKRERSVVKNVKEIHV